MTTLEEKLESIEKLLLVLVERQQMQFNCVEMLARFDNEIADQLRIAGQVIQLRIHAHGAYATDSRSPCNSRVVMIMLISSRILTLPLILAIPRM